MSSPEGTGWRRVCGEVAAALFFLGAAVVATRPLAFNLRTHTLAGGDPLVDLWTVNWIASHVFEPRQMFEGNMFRPAPHAVLFADPSLGTAVLLAPLRAFVGEPLILYNLGVLLALAFGGWCFQLLVRDLTGNYWAGLLAGTLAAFNAHQMRHVVYLNLLTIGWLALFLLGLHRCLRRPSYVAAVVVGASFALTVQSTGYYAVAAVLLAVLYAALHARAIREPRVMATLAVAGVVACALSLPFLIAYSEIYGVHGLRRPLGMSVRMSFQPMRDLTSRAFVYHRFLPPGGGLLFPGLVAPVLAGVALVRRRPHAAFYALAAGLLLVLALGPELAVGRVVVPMPYRWLRAVPPLDGMRHPVTFLGVAMLALAVMAGLGWAALDHKRWAWAGPLVVLLALAESICPALALQPVQAGVPAAYRILDTLPPGAILELPVYSEGALLTAARRPQMQFVNGQGSAFVPNDTRRLDTAIQNSWFKTPPADVDDTRGMELLLDHFPIRYLILPAGVPGVHEPLLRAFDRSRHFTLLRVAEDGARLYERCEAQP